MAGHPSSLIANTTAQVALYILNNKRNFITGLEAHHGHLDFGPGQRTSCRVQISPSRRRSAHRCAATRSERTAVNMDWGFEGEDDGANRGC